MQQRSRAQRFTRWCRYHPRLAGGIGAAVLLIGIAGAVSDDKTDTGRKDAAGSPSALVSTAPPANSDPATPPRSTTSSASARPSEVAVDRKQRSTTSALAVLATLPVKGRAPKTGYDRDQFGTAWTDANDDPLGRNGCDTRNDILARDLTGETFKPGSNQCAVLTGRLDDPYTAHRIAFRRGATSSAVQIDHVVALSNAWQTGAQRYDLRTRTNLANDPLNLLAVDGPTNGAKGDGDAATWLPPNRAYRCAYVARQVAVKARYHLWITAAERDASRRILTSCPGQLAPAETTQSHLTRTATPTPSTTSRPSRRPRPTPTSDAPAGCTITSTGSCIRAGQFCPKASYGTTGTDESGRSLTCTGDSNHPRWT